MDFIRRIITILNKPFPEDESRFGAPKTIISVSLFVIFFLYIFEPFGISLLESNKFLICLGFGCMTFLAFVIYEFVVGQVLNLKAKREEWTFWKWIVNNLGILFSISLANFLFARLAIFGSIEWEFYPFMLYGTLMVGIIPIVMLGGWSLMRHERQFKHIAAEINQQKNDFAIINSLHEDSLFDIPLSQIKYVEALQNYVKIGYLNNEGQFLTKTERATLKHILEETKGSVLVRSHRSFLVNRNAIISADGNAQGLLLTLADCAVQLPVSRSYVSTFREKKH